MSVSSYFIWFSHQHNCSDVSIRPIFSEDVTILCLIFVQCCWSCSTKNTESMFNSSSLGRCLVWLERWKQGKMMKCLRQSKCLMLQMSIVDNNIADFGECVLELEKGDTDNTKVFILRNNKDCFHCVSVEYLHHNVLR